jgi:hypothetical protein
MPSRGYVAPPERPWSVEVGARYWYSVGSNAYDYFDTTGTLLVSRLTYEDTSAHSGEAFFRIDHKSGFFLKGFAGAGSIVDGTLIDEDFPPVIVPYSRRRRARSMGTCAISPLTSASRSTTRPGAYPLA